MRKEKRANPNQLLLVFGETTIEETTIETEEEIHETTDSLSKLLDEFEREYKDRKKLEEKEGEELPEEESLEVVKEELRGGKQEEVAKRDFILQFRGKEKRITDNKQALQLVDTDPTRAYELFSGLGGLMEAEEGEDFLAGAKKALGQYFTPYPVSYFLAKLFHPPEEAWVFDPTCGKGSLLEVFEYCSIIGVDIDKDCIDIAKARFPKGVWYNRSILDAVISNYFDYVVFNPPFGLSWRDDDLKLTFNFRGKLNSELAVTEVAIRSCVAGGFIAAVLPERIFTQEQFATLQKFIREETEPVLRIDLPDSIWEGIKGRVKTSLYVMRRKPCPEIDDFGYYKIEELSELDEVLEKFQEHPVYSYLKEYTNRINHDGQAPSIPYTRRPKKRKKKRKEVDDLKINYIKGSELQIRLGLYGGYRIRFRVPDDPVCRAEFWEVLHSHNLTEASTWRFKEYRREITSIHNYYKVPFEKVGLISDLIGQGFEIVADKSLRGILRHYREQYEKLKTPFAHTIVDKDNNEVEAYPIEQCMISRYREEFERNYRDLIGVVTEIEGYEEATRGRLCLYPYQIVDASRLLLKKGTILALKMGLGKTRIVLAAMLLHLKRKGGKGLVIAKASNVINVWQEEVTEIGIADKVMILESYRDCIEFASNDSKLIGLVSYERLVQDNRPLKSAICLICGNEFENSRCSICGYNRKVEPNCPQCGAGSPQWTGQVCLNCGNTIWIHYDNCPECGARSLVKVWEDFLKAEATRQQELLQLRIDNSELYDDEEYEKNRKFLMKYRHGDKIILQPISRIRDVLRANGKLKGWDPEARECYSCLYSDVPLGKKIRKVLKRIAFRFLVIDESVSLKNKNSKRSQYCRAIIRLVRDHICYLSGTGGIKGRVLEDWGIQAMALKGFSGTDIWPYTLERGDFLKMLKEYGEIEYIPTKQGGKTKKIHPRVRPEMLQEFNNRTACVLIRRTSKEGAVSKYVPPFKEKHEVVWCQMLDWERRFYEVVLTDMLSVFQEMKRQAEERNIAITQVDRAREFEFKLYWNLTRVLSCPESIPEFQYFFKEYKEEEGKELLPTKVKLTEKIVKEALLEGKKVVIFTTLNDMARFLMKHLKDIGIEAEIIIAEVDKYKRLDILRAFNSEDKIKVLVCGIECMKEGINIKVTNRCLFLNPPWDPYTVIQAMGRLTRIGQPEQEIQGKYLFFNDSIEQKLWKLILSKWQALSETVDRVNVGVSARINMFSIADELLQEAISAGLVLKEVDLFDFDLTDEERVIAERGG